MQHTLNTDVVEMTGSVIAGILFNAIDFYIDKIWGDETRLHDGDYWTYSSNKSLQKSFPYLSAKQVRSGMDKLIERDLLKTGNFNQVPYDRTTWYSFGKNGYSICHFCQKHLPKKADTCAQKGEPIPVKSNPVESIYLDISSCAKRSLPRVDEDSNEYKLANFILESVKANFPNVRVKDNHLTKWALDIEKIHRIDGYDWQTICDVLEFALNDKFWKQNIRSGEKFREKFDDLLIRKDSYDKRNS